MRRSWQAPLELENPGAGEGGHRLVQREGFQVGAGIVVGDEAIEQSGPSWIPHTVEPDDPTGEDSSRATWAGSCTRSAKNTAKTHPSIAANLKSYGRPPMATLNDRCTVIASRGASTAAWSHGSKARGTYEPFVLARLDGEMVDSEDSRSESSTIGPPHLWGVEGTTDGWHEAGIRGLEAGSPPPDAGAYRTPFSNASNSSFPSTSRKVSHSRK